MDRFQELRDLLEDAEEGMTVADLIDDHGISGDLLDEAYEEGLVIYATNSDTGETTVYWDED